jgi:hypothetical protein
MTRCRRSTLRAARRAALAALIALLVPLRVASAQSMQDALSFLVTNRSVQTGDFVRDQQAALATRDAISQRLVAELGTLPTSPSAGGFSYRLDPSIGVPTRSSTSFGPFFSERSLTAGRRTLSFSVSYQQAVFTRIDDHDLRDGTLVSTASQLAGEATPFDVETMSLSIRSDTTLFSSNIGLTDRLDVALALPMVRISLHGDRVDSYRGRSFTQATASASTSGPGDVLVRGKYNVLRTTRGGLAAGVDVGVPTGDEDNLLGLGHATVTPHGIFSFEGDRLGIHLNAGALFGNESPEFDYRASATVAVKSRLTLIGEVAGRRQTAGGQLEYVTTPHPQSLDVETTRLTSSGDTTDRIVVIGGLKWNLYRSVLLNLEVLHPVSRSGLYAPLVPAITVDYFFEP